MYRTHSFTSHHTQSYILSEPFKLNTPPGFLNIVLFHYIRVHLAACFNLSIIRSAGNSRHEHAMQQCRLDE